MHNSGTLYGWNDAASAAHAHVAHGINWVEIMAGIGPTVFILAIIFAIAYRNAVSR